jgi:hypothetical protein
VRRGQNDVGSASVPEQKSNQCRGATSSWSTPTFEYVFAVSLVPPITAPAGAMAKHGDGRRHSDKRGEASQEHSPLL